MPELPEVETTIRALRPLLAGQVIADVHCARAGLRVPFPADLGPRLVSARVERLSRRAKYGLIATDRGDTMIFHLGMSGRWLANVAQPSAHDHLTITTAPGLSGTGARLTLRDPRRFGQVALTPTAMVDRWPAFTRLGPEPLGEAFNAAVLATALVGRAAPIKALLLDQKIVAGLGNIYVCEALALAHIAPGRAGKTLDAAEVARLVEAIRSVLIRAISAGGSSFSDYAHPDGQLGDFSSNWLVYGREGQACRCGGPIVRDIHGGRSTFWCPDCQI